MLPPYSKRIVETKIGNMEEDLKVLQKILGSLEEVDSLGDLEMCIEELKKEVKELCTSIKGISKSSHPTSSPK